MCLVVLVETIQISYQTKHWTILEFYYTRKKNSKIVFICIKTYTITSFTLYVSNILEIYHDQLKKTAFNLIFCYLSWFDKKKIFTLKDWLVPCVVFLFTIIQLPSKPVRLVSHSQVTFHVHVNIKTVGHGLSRFDVHVIKMKKIFLFINIGSLNGEKFWNQKIKILVHAW